MASDSICICGAQAGFPHAADCPYPEYRPGAAAEAAWLAARDRRRRERDIFRARPWEAEGLQPPDLEDLEDWQEEGGCEAACPHGCWVEADGWCEHGRPSWLIVLGWI